MPRTLIIAEAGVNHNGDLKLAKQLVDIASEAGADIVKFQSFVTENIVTKNAKKAKYQIVNTNNGEEGQYEMLKKLELGKDDHFVIKEYCEGKNIEFLSTPFDDESISLLKELDIKRYKIPSGEITNLPHLEKIASIGKPVIMSTGMANLEEAKLALEVLLDQGLNKDDIIILHCHTDYPTQMSDVNLNAMLTLKNELNINVGYSDHTLGIEVPIAAAALGAVCIEKHFTIDKNMEGPDHLASLNPNELNEMIRSIRNIESALGNGLKEPTAAEKLNRIVARKSIHLSRDLNKDHKISRADLIMKRPGDGISPFEIMKVIGKSINKDLEKDYKLTFKEIN